MPLQMAVPSNSVLFKSIDGDCFCMCVMHMWPRFYWFTDVTRWM